jgi:hypothetical protein
MDNNESLSVKIHTLLWLLKNSSSLAREVGQAHILQKTSAEIINKVPLELAKS